MKPSFSLLLNALLLIALGLLSFAHSGNLIDADASVCCHPADGLCAFVAGNTTDFDLISTKCSESLSLAELPIPSDSLDKPPQPLTAVHFTNI